MMLSSMCVSAEDLSLDQIRQSLTFYELTEDQSISNVTDGFYLPVYYKGAFIVWKSDNENVLRIVGDTEGQQAIVMRPPFGEGYATVGLTAYISKDDSFVEKNFLLRIKEQDIGFKYSDTIKKAYEEFEMEFLTAQNIFALKDDLHLPAEDTFANIKISYWFDNNDVISETGKIVRNYENDQTVNLYVCFTEGFETFKTNYKIVIKAYSDEEIRAKAEKDIEEVIKQLSDKCNLLALNDSISLPTSATNGSTISWSSADSSIINDSGKVFQGSEKKETTLTVTAEFHNCVIEKELPVAVLAKGSSSFETGSNIGISGGGGSSSGGNGSSGGGGNNSGGNSSGNSNSGSTNTPVINPDVPAKPVTSFNDVATSHWAYSAITELTKSGILNGVGEGKFAPDMPLTREQTVKILLLALDFEVDENINSSSFEDCTTGAWYIPYIETARKNNIINGISSTTFGVGNKITRQEFATIVARALKQKEISLPETVYTEFEDSEEISEWAKDATSILAGAGIIRGSNNKFCPADSTTRAEAAVMIHRILSINSDFLD